MSSILNTQTRQQAIETVSDSTLDVLVIGGGVTGAGIVLDAATRGLKVGIVEADDWASGTSSWSSKLLHGGLRYLEMLDFALVHEAILERNLLLRVIAPHLSVPVPFIYPLHKAVTERAYVGSGITLYDSMAWLGGTPAVPGHRHLTRRGLHDLFPGLDETQLAGGIRYFDARIDDARLVSTLVRTAAHFGARAINRAQVTALTTDEFDRVRGAEVLDRESGQTFSVRAKNVINATGVWTEQTEALSGTSGGLKVLASKGVHIVVPRERIPGHAGIISQTEKSVLFVIPWKDRWIIGTTDTPYTGDYASPVATEDDIAYLIGHVNELLVDPISREDVIGTYAGLRPLLQPGTKAGTASTKVSREHTVASPAPGLTVIAGGKLTTYRVMAEDAVNFALGPSKARKKPSRTKQTPLLGARGLDAITAKRAEISRIHGWPMWRVNRLINRYGTLLYDVLELIGVEPELSDELEGAPGYLQAEVVYAVTNEGALHLDDVMERRTRLSIEYPDRGAAAVDQVSRLMAAQLGWSEKQRLREVSGYLEATAHTGIGEDEDFSASEADVPSSGPAQGTDAVRHDSADEAVAKDPRRSARPE